MSQQQPKRLGDPLGTIICAYYGGTAWRFLLEIQRLNLLSGRTGIETKTLGKDETPPPGSVLLREKDDTCGFTKFSPRPIVEDGVKVIEIPLVRAVIKPKRFSCTAGMIGAMIWRGDKWSDRSGRLHNNPL